MGTEGRYFAKKLQREAEIRGLARQLSRCDPVLKPSKHARLLAELIDKKAWAAHWDRLGPIDDGDERTAPRIERPAPATEKDTTT